MNVFFFYLLTLKLLLYVPDIGQFWQYIVCTAKLAYVPVRITGTLEYLWKRKILDVRLQVNIAISRIYIFSFSTQAAMVDMTDSRWESSEKLGVERT